MTGFLRTLWNRSAVFARQQITTKCGCNWQNNATLGRSLPGLGNQIGISQCRTILSGPPTNKITPMENTIAFIALFIGVCVPSGYIMANLDSYRTLPDSEKRDD